MPGRVPDPTVSIVMPVWNAQRFLREAVVSVLDQSFEDFELLAIDDGSTDASIAILEGCADRRIRIIHQGRRGLVEALNRGLKEARGRYVARMDADDISLPLRLERQVAYLDAHPSAGLVAPWAAVVDEGGIELGRILLPPRHEDLMRCLLLRNPIKHGSVMVRAETLGRVGRYRSDYGANEDYDLWRRIARHAELAGLPEVLYRYREHADSHSTVTVHDRIAQRERLRDELWGDFARVELGTMELVRRAHAYRSLGSAHYAEYVADQRALAREAFKRRRIRSSLRMLAAVLVLEPTAVRRLARIAGRASRRRR